MRRTLSTLLAALCLCSTLSAGPPQDVKTDDRIAAQKAPPDAGTAHAGRKPPRQVVVPVRDVDDPGRNPFQLSFDQTLQFLLPSAESTFDVPAGKRLVIEQVSALAQGQASASSLWGLRCVVSTLAEGETGTLALDLGIIGLQAGINQVAAGITGGLAYADGGTAVTTTCTRVNFSSRSVRVQISVFGHFVDERTASARSGSLTAPRGSDAVLIRNVDTPGLHPFQRTFHVDATPEGFALAVPEGRRLVIDHVSIRGAALCTISATADDAAADLFIATASASAANPILIGNERVHAYADGGSAVSVHCSGASSFGPAAADVSLVGHLVRQDDRH
jgi:hypothetical protein